ncbi:flagellar filament capping protein FliD [Limnohabitans sp. 2KL-3]|uniref:flagellar filament capping protein FliD n=1 Tax=Limnohabitans sp. 2KL-3 TaxID=1100700 RepID=UPI000B08042A|nr:flagellar filament capping protein FliD [Limnohabitans sp. 2KL-3]
MATSSIVNTLGAGSGIDVKSLAQSLVDAEKTPKKERIDAKITKSEARITGYGAIKFALSDLKNAFAKLNDASDFSSIKTANTQPAAFGVTASSTADTGQYSIEVLQTALAQRTASSSFAERSTALNGGAAFTLDLSVGGVSKGVIKVTPPDTPATPAGMVSAINGAKLGVTAQLINTSSGYKVVITGETGAAKNFSLSSKDSTGNAVSDVSFDTPLQTSISFAESSTTLNGGNDFTLDLNVGGVSKGTINVTDHTPNGMVSAINAANLGVKAQLINSSSGYNVAITNDTGATQNFSLSSNDGTGTGTAVSGVSFVATPLQTATDARFKINGLEVTRSSNTVTDVIDGVTLDLFTNTTGAARLDLNRETAAIKDNIKGLVTAYNDFEAALNILGDRDSEVEEFGGALAGESLLQTVRTQVRNLVTSTSTTPGTTIRAGRDLGLSIDRNGKLTLDETKLDTALQNKFGEVSTMFSAGTNNKSIYSPAPAGLAGDAIKSIEKMLLSTSLIDTQSKSVTTKIAQYKKDLIALEDRMDKLMTRYMSQFSIMESFVGNSNSMREGLKSTFTGMMKAYE